MPAPSLSSAVSKGIGILNTIVDAVTHTIMAVTGDAHSSTSDAEKVEWWQHVGFISRPSKAAAGQTSAEGFIYRSGSNDACIASRDTRGQSLAGNIAEGETCLYSGGSDGNAQARVLLKANGTINVYTTTTNDATGQSILFAVGPTGIQGGTPWGAFSLDSNGLTITIAGGSGLKLGTDGTATLIGATVALNGGSINLGALASPASPVVWGVAGISGVGSTSVFCSV